MEDAFLKELFTDEDCSEATFANEEEEVGVGSETASCSGDSC
jgi:hypothetical protein